MANEPEYSVVVLQDEAGNDVTFELLDVFPFQEHEYVILYPASGVDTDVMILQTEKLEDGSERYVSVEEESTLMAVFQIFRERAGDLFDFAD